ncbi:MAG TPA: signal peptidase I [Woeseiaceae bacterium]|nr:signal peptidase I [Woeseiaceae bacterium]
MRETLNINLALILTLLTAFSGVVVAYDRFIRQKRLHGEAGHGGMETLVEYARSFFPVLLLVLVIRSFIFEPFRIPSGSMMPTLLQGDYIFVKKYAYGLRLPVLETKVVETGEPRRGDVAVFRLPSDPSINYIKRVVGLPGDRIVYRDHRLTINGEEVALAPDSEEPLLANMPRYVEQLDEHRHDILIANPYSNATDGVYTVPEGHYFMMGDNRDNSRDSRYIGAIPESYLVGEAVLIWMHMDGLAWPRWERIGTEIR